MSDGGRRVDGGSVVRGAMLAALRLSRAAGVAPLRLTARRGAAVARPSRPLAVYGFVLVTVLNIVSAVRLFMMFTERGAACMLPEESRGLGYATKVLQLVWTGAIAGLGAYGGLPRARRLLAYLDTINRVKLRVYARPAPAGERGRRALAALLLLLAVYVLLKGLFSRLFQPDFYGCNNLFALLSLGYYVTRFMSVVLQLQMMFLMYEVQGALRAVNDDLLSLDQNINLNRVSTVTASKLRHAVLSDASRSVVSLWAVVRRVNDREGPLLLLLVACYGFDLFVSAHHLILPFKETKSSMSTWAPLNIMDVTMWWLFHSMKIVLLVEPSHRMSQEVSRTCALAARLQVSQGGAPRPPRALPRVLRLARPAFAPLGLFALDRPLLTSLTSVVVTTLVTFTQYHRS